MGLILLAAPSIDRFHLHEQLGRRLLQAGHRLITLSTDPANHIFYRAQGMPSVILRPQRRDRYPHIPLEEFALRDCRLAGLANPGRATIQRAHKRLESLAGPITRLFEIELPDLVFLHQGRSGIHRLIQFIGHEFGAQIMHTGSGLLPGTMQWNDEGIDGDSSSCQRTARDYRSEIANDSFLSATLGALLGTAKAPPLARQRVIRPDVWERISLAAPHLCRGNPVAAYKAANSWQHATANNKNTAETPIDLPVLPFYVVLLQPPSCPRLLLDAGEHPNQATLIRASSDAVKRLDAGARILVLPPPNGLDSEAMRVMSQCDFHAELMQACHANTTIAMASAAITINHPIGMMAILADTPLVHLGRSPYQVTGVAQHGNIANLSTDLERGLNLDNPTLRRRFSTRQLTYDHVWCDAEHPDANGMQGILQDIDRRLNQIQTNNTKQVAYRAGPVWPLTSTTRPSD